jgi:tetratricopeptide (TPR) repeat protein
MSTIYYFQNDSKKSEEMVRHSIDIRQQDPLKTSALPLHRYALAGDYFTLNNSLQLARKYDDAIKVLKSATEVLEPVVNLYPQDTRFQIMLCKIYYGLGQATHGNTGPFDAIAWFSRSAEMMAELKQKLRRDRAVEFILQHSYEPRAICWREIEETDKAKEDMKLAHANAAPKDRHRVAFNLGVAYAQSDQFDKALEIADQMVTETEDVETVGNDERVTAAFTATRIYASTLEQQAKQTQTEATKMKSNRWVKRCLELLKIVDSFGSLQTDQIKNVLLEGAEFEGLRQQPEFRNYLKTLYGED